MPCISSVFSICILPFNFHLEDQLNSIKLGNFYLCLLWHFFNMGKKPTLLFFKNFFSKKKILLLCFALFCLFVFELHLILQGLNMREGDGILGVGVKSVDIKRNVRGESDRLDHR